MLKIEWKYDVESKYNSISYFTISYVSSIIFISGQPFTNLKKLIPKIFMESVYLWFEFLIEVTFILKVCSNENTKQKSRNHILNQSPTNKHQIYLYIINYITFSKKFSFPFSKQFKNVYHIRPDFNNNFFRFYFSYCGVVPIIPAMYILKAKTANIPVRTIMNKFTK